MFWFSAVFSRALLALRRMVDHRLHDRATTLHAERIVARVSECAKLLDFRIGLWSYLAELLVFHLARFSPSIRVRVLTCVPTLGLPSL
ncbi:hypothetical protein ABN028_30150 [Actinopolymorpha sp. B17G11]|uniref:hypothetical protein n=1 Tax=Actinopolymorpha sp. B17G11 TaxID=3160861 RepID=UPI0032E36D3E